MIGIPELVKSFMASPVRRNIHFGPSRHEGLAFQPSPGRRPPWRKGSEGFSGQRFPVLGTAQPAPLKSASRLVRFIVRFHAFLRFKAFGNDRKKSCSERLRTPGQPHQNRSQPDGISSWKLSSTFPRTPDPHGGRLPAPTLKSTRALETVPVSGKCTGLRGV